MIRLRTLGTLDLRGSEGEELRAVLAQPRRAALLAYLALAMPRGTQRRDTVLALFWPELDLDRARNALGQALHFLRRSIGADVIVNRNGEGLAIDSSKFWCDAAAFEEALDANRISEALALYRGDLLEGFHISDAPEFEHWLDSERTRLIARYTQAVESVATEREAARDFHGAVTHWRALAARDAYSSRLTLRLMRALRAAGDPAGALLQAREHERLLREELGIAPDADVTALVGQLQAGEASVVLPPTPAPDVPTRRVELPEAIDVGATGANRSPRSRRAPLLAGALILVSVGVAAAVVLPSPRRERPYARELMALYENGRRAEISRSLEGVQTAAAYYRSAIERDSSFALGYAGLSDAYTHMAHYDFAPKVRALDSARILAQRAVKLDSTLPETRSSLAMSLVNDGHFDLAEKEFRRAIELGPSNARPSIGYGMLLVSRARGEEALIQAERAIRLDPAAPRAAQGVKWQAQFLVTGKRDKVNQPITERRPTLKRETGEPWARAHQAVELARENRCSEAHEDMSRARRLVPDSNMVMLAFAGMVEFACGDVTEARKLMARMKRHAATNNDHAFRVALLHAALGEKDSAFDWLERHQRWMVSELTMIGGAEYLDPLRGHPRFVPLQRRLGVWRDTAAAEPRDVFVRRMYARAQESELSRNQADLEKARDAYTRAMKQDPKFAPAYAGLAGLYRALGGYGFLPLGPALDSADMMAHLGFTLDSALSETRTAMAVTLADSGKFHLAELQFQRATQLNPSDARAHYWYSVLLVVLGRGEQAAAELKLARAGLQDWRGVQAMERYAQWLITGRRDYLNLPVEKRRPSLTFEPGDPWAIARQAEDLAQTNKCTAARADLDRADRLAPDNVKMRRFISKVDWLCGERARARALLDDTKGLREARDHAFDIAAMHVIFSENDSAFTWLEQNRWTLIQLSQLRASPYFDPLRSDRRFAQLERQLGIRR
jgi:DNA-binding SARP family transcriptional activator/Tfp pilus assembly protein PilF